MLKKNDFVDTLTFFHAATSLFLKSQLEQKNQRSFGKTLTLSMLTPKSIKPSLAFLFNFGVLM